LTVWAAWWIYLRGNSSHYRLGLALLLGYVTTTVVLLVPLELRSEPERGFVVGAQVSDIGWPALLCLFAEGPNSTFFLLFLFAMIAAAFRWGFWETMATALISAGVLFLQAGMATFGPLTLRHLLFTPVGPARLVVRCAFLLMAGSLLGFLAETEKQLRAEVAFTNRLLSLARVGDRFASVLQRVLAEFGRVFDGKAAYEIAAQSSSGRTFKWELPSLADAIPHVREISPADKSSELLSQYPYAFFMRRRPNRGCMVTALDEEGRRLSARETKALPMPVGGADSVLVVSHEIGHDWYGRLILVNARLGWQREHELRFAQSLIRQLAPILYAAYLFRSFRSHAGATERAKMARELHDTAIQSLIGIEMQVDVLRRHSIASPVATELGRIQELLRHEVLNLRELMQTMRPIDIGPHQLLDFMAGLVERFSRDTGVAVRFISESHEVPLPAATCCELARIVQEGLVNIRKHSSARSAIVRFGAQDGVWKLVIDDDGKGFPFSGRFTLKDLDGLRQGPAIIKERVRAVGGDMIIESTPGHGSRLEITVPLKGHESYG
jgi:signal transduction histidine kinase